VALYTFGDIRSAVAAAGGDDSGENDGVGDKLDEVGSDEDVLSFPRLAADAARKKRQHRWVTMT